MSDAIQPKSRLKALLLFFFFYCFGLHFFYLKQNKMAFIQIGLFVLAMIFQSIWASQTNFGSEGGSIFYGFSLLVGLGSWIWGLIQTIKLTKKQS